jgi:CheY-like chemotaxis protein
MKTKGQNYNWAERTILVAEDVQTNYLLIEAILSTTRVNLIWARNGQEAVEKCLDNDNIDLVLMDIRMPVMNGMEATKAILKIRNSLPIIAQTAFTFNYEAEKIRKAGCREVLAKPITPEALVECISTYFTV